MSKSVSARVPEDTVERVEHLVEDGEFETRSEAVAELLTQRVDELGVELPGDDSEDGEEEEASSQESNPKPSAHHVGREKPPIARTGSLTFARGAKSVLGEIASYTLPEVPLAALAGGWVVYGGGAQVLGIPALLGPVFAAFLVLGAAIA